MATERRKTLLLVGITLIIGVFIGALTTLGSVRHFNSGRRHHGKQGRETTGHQRIALSDRIFSMINADSSQHKLMRPIIESIIHSDSVGRKRHHYKPSDLDSLKVKLSPILRGEQKKKLEVLFSKKHKSSLKRASHQIKQTPEADYWTSL